MVIFILNTLPNNYVTADCGGALNTGADIDAVFEVFIRNIEQGLWNGCIYDAEDADGADDAVFEVFIIVLIDKNSYIWL